jgi:hypothetical protein
MRNYPSVGVQVPNILLPKPGVSLEKWAVIACDQFSSEPEYWAEVKRITSSAPSTYEMILPEVMLGTPEELPRIQSTQQTMRQYLDSGIFQQSEGLILVEREVMGKTRRGVMLALDLERYDFTKGSKTLIRATEGTILDRLPPRIRIREGAPLELPHILVLIDDPSRSTIESLFDHEMEFPRLYDFDLMLGSGHLRGYQVNRIELEEKFIRDLERLAEPAAYHSRYRLPGRDPVLLFAMGDGNHSFATAKAIWEKMKGSVPADHPARFVLVEVVNVHDAGLEFEPIHRVLFNLKNDLDQGLQAKFGVNVTLEFRENPEAIQDEVLSCLPGNQKIGCVDSSGWRIITFRNPTSNLAVGTLQGFLDEWKLVGGFEKIDYVHGWEAVTRLGQIPGNTGFFLPAMQKTDLFKTVILDGALPRKTFSMGEAKDKRFYMECRKIVTEK